MTEDEERIADAMDPAEQAEIGEDYRFGSNGKPQDMAKAAFYLLKAAERGNPLATCVVAWFYVKGQGLPQDLDRARVWAMKAKSQGSIKVADEVLTAIDAKQNGISATPHCKSVMPLPEQPSKGSKAEPPKNSTFWSPILFIAGVGLLLYIADQVDKNSPGAGRLVVGWTFGLGALGIFLNIVWGPTIKDVGKNLTDFMKALAWTALGLAIFAGIGNCSGGLNSSPADGLGGVPDQVRKP
jgi:hypothetical protein